MAKPFLSSVTIYLLLVILAIVLQISTTQEDDFLDAYRVGFDDERVFVADEDTYLSYHIQTELLQKGSQYCTNFVFPGKSLCNLVVTQIFTMNMNLNGTKGARATTFTPAIPISSAFQEIDIVSVKHVNKYNESLSENCAIESTVNGREADGKTKNIKWRISFAEKEYPNPQLFQIVLKAVGAVKPIKATKQNTFTGLNLISSNVLPSIQDVGYRASIFIPYNHTKIEDYDIEPKTYTKVKPHLDGTFTVEYNFEQTKFTPSSHNLTLSMVFPAMYPDCLVIRWPSIVMWSVSGGLVVLILVYVVIQCTVEQIQKRRGAKEYVQID